MSEKHIECHACANLFNYPAILHLFKCSNRHLKLLPAQKARKYTTPKLPKMQLENRICFTTLWIYTTPKHNAQYIFEWISFTTLWIYTTPKPQKRTEAATSAYITRLFNYILSYHLPFVRRPYWLLYLCKFVQLPCDLVPLQMLK